MKKKMLPLFGRRRKTAVVEIPMESIDEWCIPSDNEMYGRSKVEKSVITDHETDKKEDIKAISDIKVVGDTTAVNDITTISDIMSVSTADATVVHDSFQSLNNVEVDDEVVIMNESEINFNFSNETFSIMNNETTIVDTSAVHDTSFPTDNAFKTVLERLVTLERKYEELNNKVTKMEEDAQKENSSDSNASIFVNEFIGFMQDVMKSGLSYQQQFMGKFIDELDGMFDFDLNDFDPLS